MFFLAKTDDNQNAMIFRFFLNHDDSSRSLSDIFVSDFNLENVVEFDFKRAQVRTNTSRAANKQITKVCALLTLFAPRKTNHNDVFAYRGDFAETVVLQGKNRKLLHFSTHPKTIAFRYQAEHNCVLAQTSTALRTKQRKRVV